MLDSEATLPLSLWWRIELEEQGSVLTCSFSFLILWIFCYHV